MPRKSGRFDRNSVFPLETADWRIFGLAPAVSMRYVAMRFNVQTLNAIDVIVHRSYYELTAHTTDRPL